MRHALRHPTAPTEELRRDPEDSAPLLDDEAVLAHLETDLYSDPYDYHGGDPVAGIFNGVMLGLAIWIVVIAAIGVVFW